LYQNIWVNRNQKNIEVHLWDDEVGYKKFSHKSYAYKKTPTGTYQSFYGDKLKKVNFWTPEDLKDNLMFESDVPIETRILVDNYYDSDEVSKGHREMIIDIEVEVTQGFPDPNSAENKITAIAIYDKVADKYYCYVLGNVPNTDIVESFESEEELLQRFYQKYLEISPTIISGWNTDFFDIPYLYNRSARVVGQHIADTLSPIGQVYWSEHKNRYKIAGVSQLDYLALYRLFTYTQQSSYRLDYIGQLEVNIGKIEYEGTLQDLYENDINKYVEYNLNDVKIVKALDDKLKFIDLAKGVSHLGHIPYEEVFLSSRYLEGAILVYMKNIGVVAPNKIIGSKYDDDSKFSGAYVKTPIPGRYDWVYDLDLTSMYPSTIMTLNISPEMKLGKLDGWDAEEFVKNTPKTYSFVKNNRIRSKLPESFNNEELKEIFDNNSISVSSNGVLYKNNKKGLIPSILSKWFDERTEYKRLAKKYGNEGNKEQYGYFNRRQHVQKILLNSMYGVLGSPTFRFYDIDNAEATTTTGVSLIKYTQRMANYYYNKELNDKKDYVIYTDTDSIFCSAIPLVKNRNPNIDVTDNEIMTTKILSIASEVQDFLNKSYDMFAHRLLNVKNGHRFDIKQEVIAKSGFWVTKKRYGQWIINDGGVKCDKLDVKGLDIVRSNFPPAFRDLMTFVLKSILNKVDKDTIDNKILKFKKEMKTKPILDIALPTGVKGMKKYVDKKVRGFKSTNKFTNIRKGCPAHVRSAIRYNDLLNYYEKNNYEPIRNSDKIKWTYLKQNPFSLDKIAFKGYDDPKEIIDFIETYIDYDQLFEGQLKKKISMFYEALEWSLPLDKKNTLERFF
jgi:DNA polymerase elongation subunit (family B)